MSGIATLALHLFDNLEAGLERAIKANIADLEAFATNPED